MRLVMEYGSGDGFTYFCTNTCQIEAPSAEEAICELEQLVMSAGHGDIIEFYGWSLDSADFSERNINTSKRIFCPPIFLTVDEWFNQRYPTTKQLP